MSLENKVEKPMPSGKSQNKPQSFSVVRGIAKLVVGPAIVCLNLLFFRPSAIYFALWIAGVAMFLGGIAEIVESNIRRSKAK